MKLYEHPDFEQAVLRAAEHFRGRGLRLAVIEKDYYVTEALRICAAIPSRSMAMARRRAASVTSTTSSKAFCASPARTSTCQSTSAIPSSSPFWSAPRRSWKSPARKANCALKRCPWTTPPSASPTSPKPAPSLAGSRRSLSARASSSRWNTSRAALMGRHQQCGHQGNLSSNALIVAKH